jgi:peptidoglycan/xylan/chitin deacetylase (PgdA/CDA1 family)
MEAVCKNHPDRVAKKKCYTCKQPVCSECQIQKSNHIFCSQSCYRSYIIDKLSLSQTEQLITFQLKKALYLLWNKIDKTPGYLFTTSILAIGLISSVVISILIIHRVQTLQNKIDNLNRENIRSVDSTKSVADTTVNAIDTLTILSPPANAMIVRNRFDIEGQAEDNRVVTLSANGKLIQTTLVNKGIFSFKNLVAKPGDNHFVIRSISEDGSNIIIEEITFKYGTPTPSFLARDFSRGNLADKKIALTFDGDYLDNITSEILDILKQENIKCTIFLTGRYIQRYSDLVKRMVADGHEIGNHSWDHPHLTTFEQNHLHQTRPEITSEKVQQELLKTAEFFRQVTGKSMAPLWRAPYGEHNAEIRNWAAAVGFRQIGWTVGRNWGDGMDTLDWVADKTATTYHSADEIAEKILSFANNKPYNANGAIILMHLGTQRNDDYPHLKLPFIIQQFKGMGYQFVTISEML